MGHCSAKELIAGHGTQGPGPEAKVTIKEQAHSISEVIRMEQVSRRTLGR